MPSSARRLWFAKMSSQARSLRISNIQIEVHGWEAYEGRACNIVTKCFWGTL
jgi:hypothetical protein